MTRLLIIAVIIPFLLLTYFALMNHGYWGVIEHQFQSFASAQVFTDLVIALALFLLWMWRDAAANGRNPWPWIVLTFVSGSLGPLLYLLVYKSNPAANNKGAN